MVLNSALQPLKTATASSTRNYSQSAGCSTEQILTPVSIRKIKSSNDDTPGFRPAFSSQNEYGNFGGTQVSAVGPTVHELDPYFTTVLVMMELLLYLIVITMLLLLIQQQIQTLKKTNRELIFRG